MISYSAEALKVLSALLASLLVLIKWEDSQITF